MSKHKNRTTITTLASTYGLSTEDVICVTRAEGIADSNYDITREPKRWICAELELLQKKQGG